MSGPGFWQEYETMLRASRTVSETAEQIRSEQGDFVGRASLDHAIPGWSGEGIPVVAPGVGSPDLDEIGNLIASNIKGPYAKAVAATEKFLVRTKSALDDLAHQMNLSIQEYQRADEASERVFPRYPR